MLTVWKTKHLTLFNLIIIVKLVPTKIVLFLLQWQPTRRFNPIMNIRPQFVKNYLPILFIRRIASKEKQLCQDKLKTYFPAKLNIHRVDHPSLLFLLFYQVTLTFSHSLLSLPPLFFILQYFAGNYIQSPLRCIIQTSMIFLLHALTTLVQEKMALKTKPHYRNLEELMRALREPLDTLIYIII